MHTHFFLHYLPPSTSWWAFIFEVVSQNYKQWMSTNQGATTLKENMWSIGFLHLGGSWKIKQHGWKEDN
jgi:hypothetical protein